MFRPISAHCGWRSCRRQGRHRIVGFTPPSPNLGGQRPYQDHRFSAQPRAALEQGGLAQSFPILGGSFELLGALAQPPFQFCIQAPDLFLCPLALADIPSVDEDSFDHGVV